MCEWQWTSFTTVIFSNNFGVIFCRVTFSKESALMSVLVSVCALVTVCGTIVRNGVMRHPFFFFLSLSVCLPPPPFVSLCLSVYLFLCLSVSLSVTSCFSFSQEYLFFLFLKVFKCFPNQCSSSICCLGVVVVVRRVENRHLANVIPGQSIHFSSQRISYLVNPSALAVSCCFVDKCKRAPLRGDTSSSWGVASISS